METELMTENDFEIRNITNKDIPAVIEHIHRVCLSSEHLAHPRMEEWMKADYNQAALESKLTSSICLLVTGADGIVGTGFVDIKSGYISGVYVSQQGSGIGRAIVKKLISEGEAAGIGLFSASVHPDSLAMQHVLGTAGFEKRHIDPEILYYVGTDFMIWERS